MNKRVTLICLTAIGLIIMIAGFNINIYDNNGEKYVYQKIAWESLDEGNKEEIIGSWQEAKVETITIDYDFSIIPLNNSGGEINVKGKEMVVVSFDSKNEAMLGKVIVYIDPQTKKAVGIVPRM